MSLEEIDNFRKSLTNCPKCSSSEGFWITANREKSYVQCKHCGALLEICDLFSPEEKTQGSKGTVRKLKI